MYVSIADYGLIGNCRSAALVSKWGSIDWACLPDFDSQAYFCKILDSKKGGYFDIHPLGFYQSSQVYKKDSNILKTEFFNHYGRVLLTDFMPITKAQEEANEIPTYGQKFIRRIKSKVGNHKIRVEIKITPEYGSSSAKIIIKDNQVTFSNQDKYLILTAPESFFEVRKNILYCQFELKEGEERFFVLSYQNDKNKIDFNTTFLKKLYQQTLNFWIWWVSLSRYEGIFRDQVIRSVLTLKLLTFNPTGAVIAAPTTSLPEKLRGDLNWDYRYVWLRDASFTMYSFLALGYLKEAMEFMNWLEKVCVRDGKNLQIMYGVRGEKNLKERKLTHLSGYENSTPVRIGNDAYKQGQIDVYGEVLTCINLYVSSGGKLSKNMKDLIILLVNSCSKIWKDKDSGIWEARGDSKHYIYSKLMCWVGINRGINLSEKLNLEVDISKWTAIETEIKNDIIKNGFDKKLNSFVESYGSKIIDSSNLNIPLVGFLPANDPRVLSTLDITLSKLTKDWFVYRNNSDTDNLKSGEGAFFLSTFWVIDSLSVLGRVKEAKIWLEKIIHISTPLGLYAEMFDPLTKEHIGNFPQAFTHLGLINSTLNLNKALRYGSEKVAIIPSERLRQVAKIVNKQFEEGLELLIPSAIRNGLLERERRRTVKHSLLGRLFKKR